jgi:hypothetical protein
LRNADQRRGVQDVARIWWIAHTGCAGFMRRGTAACDSEWTLLCATHNLLKLWRNEKRAGTGRRTDTSHSGVVGEAERRQGDDPLESPPPSWAQQEKTQHGAPRSPYWVSTSSIMQWKTQTP